MSLRMASGGPVMGAARLGSAVAKTAMATIWDEGRILTVLRTGVNYCGPDFVRGAAGR